MNNEIKLNLALTEQQIIKEQYEPKPIYPAKTVIDLDTWLEVATYGLIETEKPRIYTDMQEHYATALETYQNTGCSPELAKYKALKDLGNAKYANRKYGKVYFTVRDEQNKTKLQNRSWWTRPLFFLTLLLFSILIIPAIIPLKGMAVGISYRNQGNLIDTIFSSIYLIFTYGLLYFEKEAKHYFQKTFTKHHILISQVFMVFLSIPLLQFVIDNLSNTLRIKFFGSPDFSTRLHMILVHIIKTPTVTIPIALIMFLVSRWLIVQLPLTIKTIRRLRS